MNQKSLSHNESSAHHRGQLEVLLSGVCFGFLGYFGHLVFQKKISPFELLSLRFLISGSAMLLLLYLFTTRIQNYPKGKILNSLLMGIFGYAVFSSCYFIALKGLSASMAVLLLYTYPVFVVLGNLIQDRRSFSSATLILVFVTVIGLTLLVGGDFQVTEWISFLIGLASGLTYAVYILGSSRWLRDADVLVSSAFIQFGAGLALFALGFSEVERVKEVFSLAAPEILALAVLCSIVPITLFQMGVQKLKEWEVSILSTTEPITALVVSVVLLNERISPIQLLGGLLVMSALFGTSWLRFKKI
jgi:drug/metabolite transporter (DMT)-like permease